MKLNIYLLSSLAAASLALSGCSNSIASNAVQTAPTSTVNAAGRVQPVPTATANATGKVQGAPTPTANAAATVQPVATAAATAASGGNSGNTAATGKPGGQEAARPGGEAAAAGGEAAMVVYSNPQLGFSFERPSTWRQDTTVKDGVRFTGADESMTLVFVKPNTQNLMAYASSDARQFAASQPNYKQVGLAKSTEVANAVLLGFQATGTSQVTGKAYPARGDRYYVALKDGRIAVLTVTTSARNYDGQGIRDMVLSLKITR